MINTWLASGCDERIDINEETGLNQYYLHPIKDSNTFMRGSCTCGVLTPAGLQTAQRFEQAYPNTETTWWKLSHTKRLKALFTNEPNGDFSVFYGPTGTDLIYWPLIFQGLLRPNEVLYNIVTCPEELGSGSILAAEGKFYASKNQFGKAIPKGEKVANNLNVKTFFLPARKQNGAIAARKDELRKLIHTHGDKPLIVNLVFGSKSGIKDDLEIIDEFPDLMWVVDLCQMRVTRELIQNLLAKGVLLMLTGSKFYQAPPYCGAILVPSKWTAVLQRTDPTKLPDFGTIFSDNDIAERLRPWLASSWPKSENVGLRLRWEIALDEMEAYLNIPLSQTETLIQNWWRTVIQAIENSPFFQIMPDTRATNNSIISFSVFHQGSELDFDALKYLFKELVTGPCPTIIGHQKVFIGQPVRYSDRSFIRLAIGSYSIRAMLQDGEKEFKNDLRLLELIERKVQELFSA